MKESTLKLIEDKFKSDINKINWEITKNKSDIKRLSQNQIDLKDTRKGLYEILRKLKEEIE